jgi:hypothetical protein
MRSASLALLLFACTGPDMVAAPGAPHEPAAGCGGPEYRLLDFQADSLLWRWERTVDAGATWTPMMIIEYRRAR